jgi:hypothetical protein
MEEIQLNEMSEECKNIIIALGLILFSDLRNSEDEHLLGKVKNVLMVQIKFGKFPDICKFLTIDHVLKIFCPLNDKIKDLLQCLFQQIIFNMSENTLNMLKGLLTSFKDTKCSDQFKLLVIASEYLVKVNVSRFKNVSKEQIQELAQEYIEAIRNFVKEFVDTPTDECLYGFTLIVRHMKNHNIEFTQDVQEIFGKFLDYSVRKIMTKSDKW